MQNNNAARFDLTLLMNEDEQHIHGSLEYNTALFEHEQMQQMMEDFQALLQAIVADPSQAIRTLPLSTTHDPALSQASSHSVDIITLFDAQVMRTPHTPALKIGSETLTYTELRQRSSGLARRLSSMKRQPQSYVGILLDRSPIVSIAMLGALRARTTYMLLDPEQVKLQGQTLLEDAGIDSVITQKQFIPLLQGTPTTSIFLEDIMLEENEKELHNPNVTDSNNVVALLYEHTQQRPQASCWQRQSISEIVEQFQRQQWSKPGYTWGIWSSYDSPLFHGELLCALVSGGTLMFVPDEIRLNGSAYCAWVAEHEIQAAFLPPTQSGDLLAWARMGKTSALRMLITHGGQLSEQRASELLHSWPDLRLIAGFGPGHSEMWTTYYEVRPASAPRRTPVLQLPLDQEGYTILDSYMQPVPQGVIGDLYSASALVRQSYVSLPEDVIARLMTHPYDPGAEPLYKTPYRARLLSNGSIELTGHEEQEIQFAGMRLWLQEVAFALMAHPEVRDAVVLSHGTTGKEDGQMVAYLLLTPDAHPQDTLARVRMSMEQTRPLYMQPARYHVLDHWPLHNDGRVHYQALPTVESSLSGGSTDIASPQSQLEQDIAEVWKRLLHIHDVSRNDTFFDRGGHSILLIRLQGELQSKLGKPIPILDLFQYPTISQFASHFQNSQDEGVKQTQVEQIRTRSEKQQEMMQRQQMRNKERRRGNGTV